MNNFFNLFFQIIFTFLSSFSITNNFCLLFFGLIFSIFLIKIEQHFLWGR